MRLSAPIHHLKRRAKAMARDRNIPLNQALDLVARDEGFSSWSLLAARQPAPDAAGLLSDLHPGGLVLLAARPGQGKTRLGLQLLLAAARLDRRAVFFTLEYTEAQSRAHLRAEAGKPDGTADRVEVITAPDMSADVICQTLAGAPPGTLAVIDYLQILDQRRDTPPLADQLAVLQDFARRSGVTLCFIAQIDRAFDPARAQIPGLTDLRLPNPVDLSVFAQACFLHGGRTRLHHLGRSG